MDPVTRIALGVLCVVLAAICGCGAGYQNATATEDGGHTADSPVALKMDGGAGDAGLDGGETEAGNDSGSGIDSTSSDGDGPTVDSGASQPSCAPTGAGMTDCGSSNESCCTSLPVVGGTYSRTYTNSGSGPAGEADPATISSFRLDKYLVTVGRFRQFVSAWNTGYTPPPGGGKHTHLNGGHGLLDIGDDAGTSYETGWVATDDNNVAPTDVNLSCGSGTWTSAVDSGEALPINCVNWWEAYAFCIWDGGFLPSEAEWEYAAAGGSEQREYPWGTTAPGVANQYAIYGCNYPSATSTCSPAVTPNIAPVGTAASGAGLWGQLDLAGDLFEWGLDWTTTYVDPCVDCANLTTGFRRTERGGDFLAVTPTSYLLPPTRGSDSPANRGDYVGLRCARIPLQ